MGSCISSYNYAAQVVQPTNNKMLIVYKQQRDNKMLIVYKKQGDGGGRKR